MKMKGKAVKHVFVKNFGSVKKQESNHPFPTNK
jgi:hypothetical protein